MGKYKLFGASRENNYKVEHLLDMCDDYDNLEDAKAELEDQCFGWDKISDTRYEDYDESLDRFDIHYIMVIISSQKEEREFRRECRELRNEMKK